MALTSGCSSAAKPDSYVQVWQYNRGNICSMRFFDVNGDGRDELIISPCSTYIFEDTVGLSSIAEFSRPPRQSRVAVQPNIAAQGSPMAFTGLPSASEVEIYSITGQLVRRQSITNQTTWLWDLRDNQVRALPAGTYFSTVRCQGTIPNRGDSGMPDHPAEALHRPIGTQQLLTLSYNSRLSKSNSLTQGSSLAVRCDALLSNLPKRPE